jgi:hypothetical protein
MQMPLFPSTVAAECCSVANGDNGPPARERQTVGVIAALTWEYGGKAVLFRVGR